MIPRGAYPADRAAALSGVPRSTVHYWAREEILVPSISPERVKLWSYTDLMGLRLIYWLRHPKEAGADTKVPAASMGAVREALETLGHLDLALWTEEGGPSVAADRAGRVVITQPGGASHPAGQAIAEGMLDLVRPFPTEEGIQGPDLQMPRPHLRIVPGKISGSPHVAHTRIETQAIAALAWRGINGAKIRQLYPMIEPTSISEAVQLEDQLAQNLARAA